jgi:hypothetical protein
MFVGVAPPHRNTASCLLFVKGEEEEVPGFAGAHALTPTARRDALDR